ncbi:Ran-binding protein 9/10 [Entomortierella parvispora]|uniref:Ran-binding protein 9/10 n=1 Tax=Entomortierella parvispora TaxID=205924 RepID=A0A9P3HFB3_9FUNG|nr:Ran-binding protein 9/10 [Entomortierella parvispora]
MPSNIVPPLYKKRPSNTDIGFDFWPPSAPELQETNGGNEDSVEGSEDSTWLLIIVIATAAFVFVASLIRTYCDSTRRMNPPLASSSTSAQNEDTGSDRGGLRALLDSHFGFSFGGRHSSDTHNQSEGILQHYYIGPHTYPKDADPDPEETFEEVDERWTLMTEGQRRSYVSAQAFLAKHPPFSVPTDITLAQYISIQEKGVSAWEFEEAFISLASLEYSQPQERPRASASGQPPQHRGQRVHVQVHDGIEISFPPMADNEASVQTNLPMPKIQEVYYWEVKMFEKGPDIVVAVGVATKPYPHTRLPGWSRHSIAYNSRDGSKYCNSIFQGYPYAPCFYEGDVVGCGYRPRTGTIFFTRNGKRLEDAYIGFGGTPRTTSPLDLHSISPSSIANLFPTVGATGSCVLHVNFGQSGFVFVEANVKKWGLAPTSGSLVPPPAYGREQGSILLESGIQTQRSTPHLKSSHSRAQIEAAEVLLQIDEDNDARVSRDFRAPTYGFLGSGSGSNFGNMTTTSGKLDGKRSSLLNIIHSAASITPSPPLAPQNFSLSKMNVDLEENSEAELELPIPLTQAPDYQGAQVESEDETPPLISDIIFNPADPDGALGLQ